MRGKVTFNRNGNGYNNKSGRLIIPKPFLEIMEITEEERDVEITYKDGKVIIEKIKEEQEE